MFIDLKHNIPFLPTAVITESNQVTHPRNKQEEKELLSKARATNGNTGTVSKAGNGETFFFPRSLCTSGGQ